MAASNGIADMASGPCQHMMQTLFGGLDSVSQSWDPVLKSAAQMNLEMLGFWNRRMQAYLDQPARLTHCRNPQDLMAEQMRFWQTAAGQYQDSGRKMMTLWAQAVPELPFAQPGSGKPVNRDYMSVDRDDERAGSQSYANGRQAA